VDRIINITGSIILGVLLSSCIISVMVVKRYLAVGELEVFTMEYALIFTGAAIVFSLIFRLLVLNND